MCVLSWHNVSHVLTCSWISHVGLFIEYFVILSFTLFYWNLFAKHIFMQYSIRYDRMWRCKTDKSLVIVWQFTILKHIICIVHYVNENFNFWNPRFLELICSVYFQLLQVLFSYQSCIAYFHKELVILFLIYVIKVLLNWWFKSFPLMNTHWYLV